MNIILYDLETTGLDINKNKIIEAYFYNLLEETCLHLLINPECKINPETIKIHNLTDFDVERKPVFKDVVKDIYDFCSENAYLISHNNINFDKPFLKSEIKRAGFEIPSKWKYIDTLRLAREMYPDLPNFKQDTLREKFGIKKDGSHRANKDVKDLVEIYKHMCHDKNIEEIYHISKNFYYKKMPFGKHKNKLLKDLPRDYIIWIMNNIDDKCLKRSFFKLKILKSKIKKKKSY